MPIVNVAEAKTTLSSLLVLVEAGEGVVIARHGVKIARLVPVAHHPDREPSESLAIPGWENFT